MVTRCPWAGTDPIVVDYHDRRWCVPVHEDRELFAMLILEGMQAGLSWTLLLKREAQIRAACHGLDPEIVASYGEEEVARLLAAPGMIRSERKIRAMIRNARAFRAVQQAWGSFDRYIWHFTQGRTIYSRLERQEEMPAQSPLSQAVSRDLKSQGFSFAGPVIVYSYLQSIGVIDDHLLSCPFRGQGRPVCDQPLHGPAPNA